MEAYDTLEKSNLSEILTRRINKKQASFTKSDTYTTHHQAIYTSRLLNFNKLLEPKNADSEEESSKFIEFIEPIDFT
ncbi:hypothetical protein C1645_841132 [Glomus cerebriforme]|uniref:Uncharacterized protein n=1 Tax=Glomus cerebriforme TaxID=658196 RepID=A0A397S3H1_9GLOM|nr:hypothetical protein C1645_841132 [Glomus cerebriforme]